MVEAAFIYPFIIIISVMLVLLMVFLFNNTQDSVQLGFQVRTAAGESAGTVQYGVSRNMQNLNGSGIMRDKVDESELSEEGNGLYGYVSQESQREGHFFSLFPVEAQHATVAGWSVLDEDYIIRTADLVFEKIES